MIVLGIETSCDECSCALVEKGRAILTNVVLSQTDVHAGFRGVVPELASRSHVEHILSVYQAAVDRPYDAIAVTVGPGLSGSLMVGTSFAKTLSHITNRPYIGVDHVKAHAYAVQLATSLSYPHLTAIVSGGHTVFGISENPDRIKVLSMTIDDACGESFDKIADYLQLPFPGAPALEQLAREGDPTAFQFPSPVLSDNNLSFSGLKTAVIHQRQKFLRKGAEDTRANLAASFQHTALQAIPQVLQSISRQCHIEKAVICGGVAANMYLKNLLHASSLQVYVPPLKLCTDNAAMVAGLGHYYLSQGQSSSMDLGHYTRSLEFKKFG